MLTVTDSNGTISRTYDNLNRVTSYTNANGDTIGYEYDNVGNLTKLTYPDGKEVIYTYNADNQMTSVIDWNGHKTSYTYDENGRLKSISRPDGSTETYTYNVIGQLLTAVDKSANGTVINEYSYAYDADGNIITENSLNEPVASDFGIDSAEMGYGLANQLNSFNGTPISYDKDGNMLNTPLGDKWGTLAYDSLNNLTDITTSAGAISYDYDAEGYRISKTEYGITTDFVVNPNAELSQVLTSTTNGETTYYVYGLGLVSQENSEGYKLYHYDYRGSTTAITNINGNITDTVYYDPYGNVVKRSGTTETPFLYVGKYGVETDTNGLYYMRARYYNPLIGTFINEDIYWNFQNIPFDDCWNKKEPKKNIYAIQQSANLYAYCMGNPINSIDYNGNMVFVVGDAIACQAGVSLGGGVYVAFDDNGNIGSFQTVGVGAGFLGLGLTADIGYFDFDTIYDLANTNTLSISVSASKGISGGITAIVANGNVSGGLLSIGGKIENPLPPINYSTTCLSISEVVGFNVKDLKLVVDYTKERIKQSFNDTLTSIKGKIEASAKDFLNNLLKG